ncbi:hypothetical protein L227DRAFT_653127 [Lentinus tigrinus ALCF2SS1-6]|uniref:F-box domain-containing protein n=1 Tax=Lentinus tigrinus ALCF2SS1-6 TaxID=1328759 RepID=A0A5C2SCH9_9APHY|nr:hypothetical protein L227DRAFT_653127 [Lentinus tigrinus ALCF2SS1-6]
MSFPIDASPAPSHRPGSEVSAPATVVASVLDYDILCVIFDGNRGPQGILTNSDLVRCALISRAFSEAALRALWKNPPTLRPLWHVLAPPNLKFPKKDDETEEYFDKIESAGLHKEAAYWRRLVGYARHIQNINAEHLFDQRDANLLELVLHENGTGRPLFPSLRSLQLSPTICTIPSFCRLFASTVRNLKCSIKFKDEPEDNEELRVLHNIANAVGSLQGTSSQLSWIYVEKRAREGLLASKAEVELLHNISGLRSLQNITLRLSAIPASTVFSLVAIPTLIFLELGTVVVDLAVPAHKTTSPALRVLRLQGRSTGLLATLRGLYAPVLRTLNVNVTDLTSTPHIFSSVAEAVAKSVNPDVFCHFSAILGDWTVPNALERLTRILRPLAPLRALRDIKLSSQSPFLPFMASDAEFADILGNARWSQLEEFSILPQSPYLGAAILAGRGQSTSTSR